MKKIFALVLCMLMMFNITVFAASEPTVSFTVDGGTKKGDKLTIYVRVKDVDRLYAASVDYIYNPEELKVTYIGGADLITDNQGILELGGETDKDGNRASYQMTFTGKVDGLKGAGNLVKIEAEALKDCNINLKPENMKVKLVKVDTSYNVSNMDFKYESFITEVDNEKPTDSNNTNTTKPNDENNNSKPKDNQNVEKEEIKNNENTNNSSSGDKSEESNSGGINLNGDENNEDSSINEIEKEKDDTEAKEDKKDMTKPNTSEKHNDNEYSNKGNISLYILAGLVIVSVISGGYVFIKKRK